MSRECHAPPRLKRTGSDVDQVLKQLEAGPQTILAMVPEMYKGTDPVLFPAAGWRGSLALLALINRKSDTVKWTGPFILLGVFATALFYGDSMITPAISVLSATEGLQYIVPGFDPYIVPTAVAILFGLFAIQARGTDKVGKLFGPIMLAYFITLAALGTFHLAANPQIILQTINPLNAFNFFLTDGFRAFVALGSVVLAVTGAEALYADMGHFGRAPIRIAWTGLVLPALALNYLGQGALVLSDVKASLQPGYLHFFSPWAFRALPEVGRANGVEIL